MVVEQRFYIANFKRFQIVPKDLSDRALVTRRVRSQLLPLRRQHLPLRQQALRPQYPTISPRMVPADL